MLVLVIYSVKYCFCCTCTPGANITMVTLLLTLCYVSYVAKLMYVRLKQNFKLEKELFLCASL